MYFEILICTILLFFYYKGAKSIRNSLASYIMRFFVLLYVAQIILAILDPYSFYHIGVETVVFFNIQICMMVCGAYNGSRSNRFSKTAVFSWPIVNINKYAIAFITVLLFYTLWNYNRMQTFILTEASMSQEARAYYYTTFFASYTLRVIDFILTAYKYVAIIVSFILILAKKRKFRIKELYYVVATLIIFALQTLISQGRLEVMVMVFIALFFMFFCRIYDYNNFKHKLLPVSIIGLGGVCLLFGLTTLLRVNMTGEGFDMDLFGELIIEPFATYFYVPILAFDYGRSNILDFGYPFLGAATLAFIVDTIILPFAAVFKELNAFTMDHVLGNSMGVGGYFPNGNHWMAMYTGCANYYLDFWYFGFFIFPYIHGMVISKLSSLSVKKPFYLICCTFFFYCTFRHTTSLGIQSISTSFFLFWAWMTVKTKTIK